MFSISAVLSNLLRQVIFVHQHAYCKNYLETKARLSLPIPSTRHSQNLPKRTMHFKGCLQEQDALELRRVFSKAPTSIRLYLPIHYKKGCRRHTSNTYVHKQVNREATTNKDETYVEVKNDPSISTKGENSLNLIREYWKQYAKRAYMTNRRYSD